ncbi:MAG: TVP38/TMEM64 family protein [Candidatus Helarchaeota archaeon]
MTENEDVSTDEKSSAKDEGIFKRFVSWIKGILDPRGYEHWWDYVFMLVFMVLVLIMGAMYLYTLLGYVSFIPIGDTEFLTTIVVICFLMPMTFLGVFGVLLYFVFMAVQAILLAIPSEMVMLTAGMLWNWIGGGLINIAGGMIAAVLLFWLALRGGKPFAVKTVGEKNFKIIDDWIHQYGIWAVIIGRMVPFIPLDLISVVSGVVDIKWRDYLIGTVIGVIPRAFFYSILGWLMIALAGLTPIQMLIAMINNPQLFLDQIDVLSLPFNVVLTITLVIVVIGFGIYYIYMNRKAKKE